MLFKVKTYNGWRIYDYVTTISYPDTSNMELSEVSDMETFMNDKCETFIDEESDRPIFSVTMQLVDPITNIKYTKMIIFNTIAFLCNNEGKTVERIGSKYGS
jgi:hypothetical protein